MAAARWRRQGRRGKEREAEATQLGAEEPTKQEREKESATGENAPATWERMGSWAAAAERRRRREVRQQPRWESQHD